MRLTNKERYAVLAAINFVQAGEWPWEDPNEIPFDEDDLKRAAQKINNAKAERKE